jgi:hypothetical protein
MARNAALQKRINGRLIAKRNGSMAPPKRKKQREQGAPHLHDRKKWPWANK